MSLFLHLYFYLSNVFSVGFLFGVFFGFFFYICSSLHIHLGCDEQQHTLQEMFTHDRHRKTTKSHFSKSRFFIAFIHTWMSEELCNTLCVTSIKKILCANVNIWCIILIWELRICLFCTPTNKERKRHITLYYSPQPAVTSREKDALTLKKCMKKVARLDLKGKEM